MEAKDQRASTSGGSTGVAHLDIHVRRCTRNGASVDTTGDSSPRASTINGEPSKYGLRRNTLEGGHLRDILDVPPGPGLRPFG